MGVLKIWKRSASRLIICRHQHGGCCGRTLCGRLQCRMIDSLIQIQDWNHLMRDNVYRKDVPASQLNNQDRYVGFPALQSFLSEINRAEFPFSGCFHTARIFTRFFSTQPLVINTISVLMIPHTIRLYFSRTSVPRGNCHAERKSGRGYQSQYGDTGDVHPSEKDSMLLIDGGVINNYPVDLVRSMGAYIVMGLFSLPTKKSLLKAEVLFQKLHSRYGILLVRKKKQ